MIKPSIGRIVWYWPLPGDIEQISPEQPVPAIVTYVYHDSLVNLAVFSSYGVAHPKTSVHLAQDDVPVPGQAEWMPFQKDQAAKIVPPAQKDAVSTGIPQP